MFTSVRVHQQENTHSHSLLLASSIIGANTAAVARHARAHDGTAARLVRPCTIIRCGGCSRGVIGHLGLVYGAIYVLFLIAKRGLEGSFFP